MDEKYSGEDLFSKDATFDKCFYLENSSVLKNINELLSFLAGCSADEYQSKIFYKHVDSNKNDFANWIRHVFALDELASRIQQIKDPALMLSEINKYSEECKKKREETFRIYADITNNLKREISDRSDFSEQAFDKINKLKQRMVYDKNQYAIAVETFREKYLELTRAITEHRKEGFDMLIPSLLLRNILPKIDYFQVSQNKDDEDHINILLDQVAQEINYAKSVLPKNLKQEVLEAAGIAAKNDDEIKNR